MAHLVGYLGVAAIFLFTVGHEALAGECDSYEREKVNEGYHPCVYKDSVGLRTIGVGLNLEKTGAKAEIESVGADYNAVLNGSKCLDDSQIQILFNKDMQSAKECVDGWDLDGVSDSARSALNDMSFNLGCGTLAGFTHLREDVSKKDYSAAKEDMRASMWCGQVGIRCERDVACME